MALASIQYPGNGTNRLFSVSFPYILRIHVKVFLNYDVVTGIGTELVDGPGFSWLSDTQVQTTAAPALGATVTIIRRTPSGVQLVVYAAGSPPTQADLNAADLQALYVIQEQADLAAATAALAANSAVAVTSALPYQPVASVANIPAPPTNGQRIEISNSTGIQSFSPLTGRPSTFIGASNLLVRLVYTTTGNTWQWVDYRVADPDSRYTTKAETDQKLDDLIDGAPGALNTLNELAAAMGNDPNFAATITNALAGKPGFADVWTRTQADARYPGFADVWTRTQADARYPGFADVWTRTQADARYLYVAQPGTGAVTRTVQSKLGDTVSVKDFGAVGDGVADDTAAINAAIAHAAGLTYGGALFFPVGSYAVTEINASLISTGFNKTVRLYGLGRNMSRIVPKQAGNVLLNMMGSSQMLIEDLHFDSTALVSQCAIFLARTTVSTNCNNNKFSGCFFTGSYSKACVVSNGSESSNWFNCRLDNTNASANYRCFWAGGGSLIGGLQSITTVNGGTVTNISNPATDNKMFGCEFYAPYANAHIVRFSQAASYSFFGCTIIGGSANNVRLVTYGDPDGARFNGPITWDSCHFEVFGTNNTVHYLNSPGAQRYFEGINNYGGYYVLADNTAVIDFNRTVVAEQPILTGSTWTSPSTAPGSSGTNAYVYALFNSSFSLKPNGTDGSLYLTGFITNNSVVDVTYFFPGATRYVNSQHSSVATALPATGSYAIGETIHRETPTVGQPIGWKCTASGTLGTLNGGATTGSITAGTNVLTVSSATGLAEGQRIDVAGATGTPFYIRKLEGTTAYLDANSTATVTGAAVSFRNATLVAMANL